MIQDPVLAIIDIIFRMDTAQERREREEARREREESRHEAELTRTF